MKTALKFILFLLLMTTVVSTYSQSCSEYYPMDKGVSYEITHYDKKDRIESVTKNSILDPRKEGGTEIALMHTVVTDNKGEETINAEYEMRCDGNKVTIDMNSVLSQKLSSSLSNSDAEAEVSGTNPVIPNGLDVGSSLPDTALEMDIKSGSIDMHFAVNTTDRKVIAKETVTVQAGTFDCIVISQSTHLKMLIAKNTTSKLWLAKGVGLVKEEEYNKKGNLISHQELTKFSK